MKKHTIFKALKAAFPHTVPVLLGYVFVGIAFGMLLQSKGYGAPWAALMGVAIYAGSMQFVTVNFLAGGFSLISIALMTLLVNLRHIFYSLTMIDRMKDIRGAKKKYMIYALTDETYSLLCSIKIPPDTDKGWFYFFVSALDQCYWVVGSVIGSLAGTLIPFNAKGIDFAMTALFIVILVEQLKSSKNYLVALIGAGCALVCRLIFGAGGFILPAMIACVVLLTALKAPLSKKMGQTAGREVEP